MDVNDLAKKAELFENACVSLQAAQNVDRANTVLNSFKNPSFQYSFFMKVYEQSKKPYCRYVALVFFRNTLLRDFHNIPDGTKFKFNKYLLEQLFKVKLKECRNEIIHTYGILQKLLWGKFPKVKSNQFGILQKMLSNQCISREVNQENQIIFGIKLRMSLLHEFSLSKKSSSIGMTINFHEQSKLMFQKECLTVIWNETINLIKTFCKHHGILSAALQLLLLIVSWDFNQSGNGEFLTTFRVIDPVSKKWRKMLVDIDVVKFLFSIHPAVSEKTAHLIRQILLQLCTISMNVFSGDEKYLMNYFTTMLNGIFMIFPQKYQDNIFDFVEVLFQIFSSFKLKNYLKVGMDLFQKVTSEFSRKTLQIISNNNASRDLLGKVFNTWTVLLSDLDRVYYTKYLKKQKGILRVCCFAIFQKFVMACCPKYLSDESLMIQLALIGRQNIHKSLIFLSTILQRNLEKYKTNTLDPNTWKECYLTIKTLGYVLCDGFKLEHPIPPRQVIFYTTKEVVNNVLPSTIQLVFSYLQYLPRFTPVLASSLIWFSNRFTQSYLLRQVDNFRNTSPFLQQLFGRSNNGLTIARLLIENIAKFYHVEGVLEFLCDVVVRIDLLLEVWMSNGYWKRLLQINQNSFSLNSFRNIEEKGKLFEVLLQSSRIIKNREMCLSYVSNIVVPFKNFTIDNLDKFLYFEHVTIGILRALNRQNFVVIYKLYLHDLLPKLKMMLTQNSAIYLTVLKIYDNLLATNIYLFNNNHKNYFCLMCIDTLKLMTSRIMIDSQDSKSEEKRCEALLTMVKVVKHLASPDFVCVENNSFLENNMKTVHQGLRVLLPLIKSEDLKYPDLSVNYYELFRDVLESFPQVIAGNDFANIVQILLQGTMHQMVQINIFSFMSLQHLSHAHHFKNLFNDKKEIIRKLTFDIIFSIIYSPFEFSVLENMSAALLGFVLWDNQMYRQVVMDIVAKSPENVRKPLMNCLSKILVRENRSNWDLSAQSVSKFKCNMKKFLLSVRSFCQRM